MMQTLTLWESQIGIYIQYIHKGSEAYQVWLVAETGETIINQKEWKGGGE